MDECAPSGSEMCACRQPRRAQPSYSICLSGTPMEKLMDQLTQTRAGSTGEPQGHFKPAVLKQLSEAVARQGINLSGQNFLSATLKEPDTQNRPKGKLTGVFASQRMGVSLAISHGWLGIAALDRLENDPECVFFADRPPAIKVSSTKNSRKISYLMACAYIAVRGERTVLIDLQTEARLSEADESGTGFYVRNVEGAWACPSAQERAKAMGMEHEVWSETSFKRQHVSNLKLLSDYYAETNVSAEALDATEAVRSAVNLLGAPTCDELMDHIGKERNVDALFRAIAMSKVFVDLQHANLARYGDVRVFKDATTLAASLHAEDAVARAADWSAPRERPFVDEDTVLWNGDVASVFQVGAKGCTFRVNGTVKTLTYEEIEKLGSSIRRLEGSNALQEARRQDALDQLLNVPEKDLQVAMLRLARVEPYIAGLKKSPSCRSLRRYVAAYRHAEITHENGFLGLIPKLQGSGNRVRRLTKATLAVVDEVIKAKYADPRNLRRIHVHREVVEKCEDKGLPAPSFSWFCRYLKTLDQYWLKTAREGSKASYPIKPRRPRTEDELNVDIEPVREWERAHIDHTEMDVETIFSDTGESLGRCWLTAMVDHYSRRVVGFSISFEPPSYRSILLTFRDCVKRHGRLPDSIVLDGGKEFRSIWFESLCAFYGITVIRRPKREPRHGAQGERFFGTENTMLLHNLTGNTQLTKNVRQMMPNVAPKTQAIWTLPALYELHQKFLFETYETMPHRELLMSPRQASERSLALFGSRPHRKIEYSGKFLLATCPSTKSGVATVTPNGVKINYFWYNADLLFPFLGKKLRVKFEPYDLSTAWVLVVDRWVRVTSRFQRTLTGLTERELWMITQEYRKRRGDLEYQRLNDRKLILFLREVEKEEQFLLSRKRALELQRVIGMDVGGTEAAPNKAALAADTTTVVADVPEDEFEIDLDDSDLVELDTY